MKQPLVKLGLTAASVMALPAAAFAQISGANVATPDVDRLANILNPIPVSGDFDLLTLFGAVWKVIILVAAILAILYLVWAGIQYIMAGTDPDKAKGARTAIYNAIIGIVVIILSYAIIVWVGGIARNNVPGAETTGTTSGFSFPSFFQVNR